MGTLRIHFTAGDLSRTRLAVEPDPLWEIVCSLHRLQTRAGYAGYADWHRQVRRDLHRAGLVPVVRERLLPVAPLDRYFPDFLTPGPVTDLDEGIDRVLGTPTRRIRAELGQIAAPVNGTWLDDLSAGRPAALHGLGNALRAYHRVAVAPYRAQIGDAVSGDRALRGARVLDTGAGQILDDLGPDARWAPPVLAVHGYPCDQDMHLDGRGITLIPSYFCWHAPIALADPGLPPALVYPARRQRADPTTRPVAPTDPERRLGPLLGHTRVAVLRAAARGATTGELARRASISPATTSHHTTILRDAGLITSQRHGNLVLHRLTAMGEALLDDVPPPA
ncbi:ArsR/SmtB family transcription factor [Micromonospora auratinigra]|uniref:Helix-turn-helix domain-containing protein n=1 Tax=Micromonospora auratinigra TaxID=261654 RepID=A0A1A9A316_9ACTN|nr:helix-turn-helix domain-containing protein [Micromonospora auratinigra]SBT50520.1 Helix-turn-helix domain-containing protein [Micromonospora auratinigra]